MQRAIPGFLQIVEAHYPAEVGTDCGQRARLAVDGRDRDRILEDQQAGDDPGGKFTKSRIAVSVGGAAAADGRGELGVCERRTGACDASDDEGKRDGRAGLDGGRSALRGTDVEEVLDCIRCGACLYSCPMWRTVGGQTYGSPYSGPIGAVITPLLEGMRGERSSELPFLSSLCGSCHEACPVGIPLHDLLVRVRGRATTAAHRRDRWRFRAWSLAWSAPLGYGATRIAGRLGLRVAFLPTLRDVDDATDLAAWRTESVN